MVKLTLSINEQDAKSVDALAARLGLSVAATIREAIRLYAVRSKDDIPMGWNTSAVGRKGRHQLPALPRPYKLCVSLNDAQAYLLRTLAWKSVRSMCAMTLVAIRLAALPGTEEKTF
jgi:hypothetical protein